MSDSQFDQLQGLISAAQKGDENSSDQLLSQLYNELRHLAASLMSRYPPGQTLQATALVHEAYLRLNPQDDPNWNGRGHFFGAAAQAMRRILVDQARKKKAVKHGGQFQRIDLTLDLFGLDDSTIDFIVLDEALELLEKVDERKVQVLLLRFLTGLTPRETAEALGVSLPTVERDWRFAKAFVVAHLSDHAQDEQEENHGS